MLGSSIAIFHTSPAHQRNILANDKNLPVRRNINIGPEVADLLVTPIYDQNKNYLGPMVTWELITDKLEAERKISEARDVEERAAAEAIASRLTALELSITRKTGENDQLYGSVTNADIAEVLAAKGFEIDRRKILLPDPIKALGENTVPVKLHRDVTAQLKVAVTKEE